MIVTEMYEGQGLGNQLWCYVTTRLLASKRGFSFGIQRPEMFKGLDFMDIDFGKQVFGGRGPQGGPPTELPHGIQYYYREKAAVIPDGSDIRVFDENLLSIPDNTKIDGLLQDSSFIAPHRKEIQKWLTLRPEYDCLDYATDDICVINFRGGGYVLDKHFFLPLKYWRDAIGEMRKINPKFRFIVVTDDVKTARKFFPEFEVYHWNIGKDYAVIHNAHYLILSNSSFAQFPAFTSDRLKYCIAPKYWARHNTSHGYWSLGYNIVDEWDYLDRDGALSRGADCRKEFESYLTRHANQITYTADFEPGKPYTALLQTSSKKSPRSLRRAAFKAKSKISSALRSERLAKLYEPALFWIKERRLKRSWRTPAQITEYKKNIRIYDIFTFFNELDLLEIRLNILDPYVDYFVLVESTRTFSGDPKPLHYREHKERFKKWNHKIIHYVVDDAPDSEDELRSRLHQRGSQSIQELLTTQFTLRSHTTGLDTKHWFREFYIKESARKALEGLNNDDICCVSDLDEIWNPELAIDYAKDDVFKPLQKPYAYFLNNRTNEHWKGWTGTIVTKYKNIRNSCLNHLRTHRLMENRYSFLRNGGWHFTFQGGYEGAKRKIEESNHFWYSPTETLPNLWSRIRSNRDFRGRNIRLWKDDRGLPKFLVENKERYKKFFK